MDIVFATAKLKKICNSEALLIRQYGVPRAREIQRRLTELRAASTLEDMRTLHQARCHELKGNRAGELAVDLTHPYRLILRPVDNPVPRRPDGGLEWRKVNVIKIMRVEDYHG